MTPERMEELREDFGTARFQKGLPASEYHALTSVIVECLDEIERLQAPLPEDLEKRLGEIEKAFSQAPMQYPYVAELTTTIRALQAKNKLLATRGLIGACDICWTSSWVPVETEAECALAHPHKVDLKDHVRCDHCWLVDHWKTLLAELVKERERNTERTFATLQDMGFIVDRAAELLRRYAVASDKANTEEKG